MRPMIGGDTPRRGCQQWAVDLDPLDSVAVRSAMYALGLYKGMIAAPSTSSRPRMG
jgi:hypothetical protein